MANIIIKKKVNLDFLGEDHKDDFLLFKSIPVGEYKKLIENRPQEEDASQIDFVLNILKDKFISGTFQGEAVTKENMEDFDAETAIACFGRLTGQEPDPKV